jgi:hypothetical protein
MKNQMITTMVTVILTMTPTFAHASVDGVTVSDIMAILKSQQAEIEMLKKQLASTNNRVAATAGAVESVASTTESYAKIAKWADKTSLGGYGELHYNNKENGNTDEVDAHRFVLFMEHEFTDEVRFFSEVELEHSISGEGKTGEVELEQAFIEWDYAQNHAATFGQFLIPVGILNETHEPDTFYGVERNSVEKNIIPATWWEAGVMLEGELAAGLNYNLAVHSGLSTPVIGAKAFKIRDGRQKVAKATAEELAYTARLKYSGITGLELALTLQHQDDISQGLGADSASALLWEGHAAYRAGKFGFRALYAMWDIDGDDAEMFGRDQQEGWYLEPSYLITPRLGVFARFSEWDNNAGDSADTEVEQFDVGLNFWLVENVVFKMDWADQDNGDGDSFNLGVGWSF